MSEEIKKRINEIENNLQEEIEEAFSLKELRKEVNQEISCRLKLLNYKENEIIGLGILDGSYSVYKLKGKSQVNKPYSFELIFVSDEFINIEELVDTDVEIKLQDEISPIIKKTIYGKIYKASEDSIVARKHLYKIEVVSPLYYLGLNNRYEIYHEKKTSDIIKEIINRYNQLLNLQIDIKLDLLKAPIREYTTQYNQSDLEFIQMLCEEEGYSLIIDYSSNDPYKLILCELNEHVIVNTYSSTCSFNHSKEFKASNHIEDYYDKNKPSQEYKTQSGANIVSSIKDNESTSQLRNDIKKYTLRDKLNLLDESYYKDLNRYTKIDSQREYVQSNIIEGSSQELNIEDSLCIRLEDEKANKKIDSIIIEVEYKGHFPNALDEYRQNINEQVKHQLQYEVEFKAIPKDIEYKPEKTIKKPRINSILTAKVSNGNSNTKDYDNSIDVDEEGRIRVLFAFEENQITSTYLRVSNIQSGNGYGSQFIPRVNQEVIVGFINGDPDCPIIIGSLHNGENKKAYNLPENKTQSYIRTNSMPQYEETKGYNELLFEDKRGEERVSIRAQRDLNFHALNNQNIQIENNSKTIVQKDKEETIQENSNLTVGKDLNENVKYNHISTIQKEKLTSVLEDYTQTLNKDFVTIVKNNKKDIIETDIKTTIKNTLLEYIEGDVSDKYLESLFIQIAEKMGVDIKEGFHIDTSNMLYQATNEINFETTSGVSLKCGGNVLTIDGSGIHFKTPNYTQNSGNSGVCGSEVKYTGDIINLRADDSKNFYLNNIYEDDYILRADTSLKDGKSVEATCFILGDEEKVLAKESKQISVQNSQLEAIFDLDDIISKNEINESIIKEIKGNFKWES
ncbi:type VI secretion system Vgr family protein [Arcobacter sp. YIC-310]|uniref:type VI secretion system Vgr family protein n=1 Tax=Arcobacter sp. YIC-310 TaxID=3376632 RepID=UPI003C200E98